MTITIEIPDNIEKQVQKSVAHGDMETARQLLLETISPTIEACIINNAMQPELPPQPSYEEFKALLDKLTDLAEQYIDPNLPPLSDYALSREAIYEGHPKI